MKPPRAGGYCYWAERVREEGCVCVCVCERPSFLFLCLVPFLLHRQSQSSCASSLRLCLRNRSSRVRLISQTRTARPGKADGPEYLPRQTDAHAHTQDGSASQPTCQAQPARQVITTMAIIAGSKSPRARAPRQRPARPRVVPGSTLLPSPMDQAGSRRKNKDKRSETTYHTCPPPLSEGDSVARYAALYVFFLPRISYAVQCALSKGRGRGGGRGQKRTTTRTNRLATLSFNLAFDTLSPARYCHRRVQYV